MQDVAERGHSALKSLLFICYDELGYEMSQNFTHQCYFIHGRCSRRAAVGATSHLLAGCGGSRGETWSLVRLLKYYEESSIVDKREEVMK